MAETFPRSSRLDNFEAKKREHEEAEAAAAAEEQQRKFEESLYADAGETDFSDEAYQRVEEANAYEAHLAAMNDRQGLSNEEYYAADEEAHPDSRGYGLEHDDALAANEAFDADKKAKEDAAIERTRLEGEAFEAKFARSATLRHMDGISSAIEELESRKVNPDTIDADERRLKDLEDRLNDLLDNYSKSDEYDADIAYYLMDRGDSSARDRAAARALREREDESKDEDDKDEDEITPPVIVAPGTPEDDDEEEEDEGEGDEDEITPPVVVPPAPSPDDDDTALLPPIVVPPAPHAPVPPVPAPVPPLAAPVVIPPVLPPVPAPTPRVGRWEALKDRWLGTPVGQRLNTYFGGSAAGHNGFWDRFERMPAKRRNIVMGATAVAGFLIVAAL